MPRASLQAPVVPPTTGASFASPRVFGRRGVGALLLSLVACITLVGCGTRATTDPTVRAAGVLPPVTAEEVVPTASPATTIDPPSVPVSPLAALVTSAGSALFDPTAAITGPYPIRLDVPSLGIAGAEIDAVGINTDGDLEVPDARRVGWFRYGARPGDVGASMLAAHIAYNGVDGVFRRLDRVAIGDIVTVAYADGTHRDFSVIALRQFPKNELPQDLLFGTTGPARLALVTCGGVFDRARSSYVDNIVAIAVPV
jgi:hypothetical protein